MLEWVVILQDRLGLGRTVLASPPEQLVIFPARPTGHKSSSLSLLFSCRCRLLTQCSLEKNCLTSRKSVASRLFQKLMGVSPQRRISSEGAPTRISGGPLVMRERHYGLRHSFRQGGCCPRHTARFYSSRPIGRTEPTLEQHTREQDRVHHCFRIACLPAITGAGGAA